MTSRNRTRTYGYRDILQALRRTGLEPDSKILAIGPSSGLEIFRGGASAILAALASGCQTLITPTFTYQTMVYPAEGPDDNAVDYPSASAASVEADFFRKALPASPLLGPLAEAVRCAEGAARSTHPILSFAGLGARDFLEAQTLEEPFAPVDLLAKAGGDVLLLGADPFANVAISLAVQRAGRKQFIRWALTPKGVVECPVFPGCTQGYGAIETKLAGVIRTEELGAFSIVRIPLRDLLNIAVAWIREDPEALLCANPECRFCRLTRRSERDKARTDS
jgi:aminoglycoside 3-N-acetyltransferase